MGIQFIFAGSKTAIISVSSNKLLAGDVGNKQWQRGNKFATFPSGESKAIPGCNVCLGYMAILYA